MKSITSSLLFAFLVVSLAFTPMAAAPVSVIPVTGSGPHLLTQNSPAANGTQVVLLNIVGVAAFPVVQQPSGQAGYVSTSPEVITQFMATSKYGSLGFLAHNYLSGSKFFETEVGGKIIVTDESKVSQTYQVVEIRTFQATEPDSPYSSFIDLKSGSRLSHQDLFKQTYGISGQLILQTCIQANGNASWGRLFVIAVPYTPQSK